MKTSAFGPEAEEARIRRGPEAFVADAGSAKELLLMLPSCYLIDLVQYKEKRRRMREMKITTFNPMILTPKADEVIRLFEELGFEKRHAPTIDTGKTMVTSTRMKDANGFHIDIAGVAALPRDMTIIRMNVDNFDEAFEMLTAKGFTHRGGEQGVVTETNKSALMISPSGFAFDLCQHIKEDK